LVSSGRKSPAIHRRITSWLVVFNPEQKIAAYLTASSISRSR
jgi:hypothetical protein